MNEREFEQRENELDAFWDGKPAQLPEEELKTARELQRLARTLKPAPLFAVELKARLMQESRKRPATKKKNTFIWRLAAASLTAITALILGLVLTPGILNALSPEEQTPAAQHTQQSVSEGTATPISGWANLPLLSRLGPSVVYASANLNELFPNANWVLQADLPDEPTQATVYRMSDRDAVTTEEVSALARRLGMNGKLYYSLMPGGNIDSQVYIAADGPARLWYYDGDFFTYRADVYRSKAEDALRLPFDQLSQQAATVLSDAGLLDFDYGVEKNMIRDTELVFYPLLDGNPLAGMDTIRPQITVSLYEDGSIQYLDVRNLALEEVGMYPLRTASQAWDALLNGTLDGRFGYQVGRELAPAMSMSWSKPLKEGEIADLYGMVEMLTNIDDNEKLVTLNGIQLFGDLQALEQYNGVVHVWGSVRLDASGNRGLQVEGWQVNESNKPAFMGVLQSAAGSMMLLTADGQEYEILSAPQDLPQGEAAIIDGRLIEGTNQIDWQSIDAGESLCRSYSSRYSFTVMDAAGNGGSGGGGGGGGGGLAGMGDEGAFLCSRYGEVIANTISGGFDNFQPQSAMAGGATADNVPYQDGETIDGLEGILEGVTYVKNNGDRYPSYTLRVQDYETMQAWTLSLQSDDSSNMEAMLQLDVHIWGVYHIIDGKGVVTLEKIEALYPGEKVQAWLADLDIIEVEGRQVMRITTQDGKEYLSKSSTYIPQENVQLPQMSSQGVLIEGVLLPGETFGSYPLLRLLMIDTLAPGKTLEEYEPVSNRMFEWGVQPELSQLISGQATVDEAQLVYLAMGRTQNGLSENDARRFVQPMWAFSGHLADGNAFSIYVQAVSDDFLQ